MVKYAPIAVLVNAKPVSTSPTAKTFLESTDDTWIRLSDSAYVLDIYNRGAFVEAIPKHKYGVAGVVVSRAPLDINFARNQILSTCPVGKRIRAHLDTTATKAIKRNPKLDDSARANAIMRLVNGDLSPAEAATLKLYVDTSGRAWSAAQIAQRDFRAYTVAPRSDHRGDRLQQARLAFAFDATWLEIFECPPERLFAPFTQLALPDFRPFAELADHLSTEFAQLPPEDWTPTQRLWAYAIDILQRKLTHTYAWRCQTGARAPKIRSIRMGVANPAEAWTDGSHWICFGPAFLARNKPL